MLCHRNATLPIMELGFWANLPCPIIGLAPMDGVTDASFRHMACKYGKPDVVFTEFTNVEGLAHGAATMLKAFWYEEAERPIVAQIFGVEVEAFYSTTVMLASLGFDGIDVNMGCPVNKVAKQGSGAGLIQTPELAKKIIRACQKGARDWANGITLEEAGVHREIIRACKKMSPLKTTNYQLKTAPLPISLKTRIGYSTPVTETWIKHLLEVEPAAITLHGRTLKQLYSGQADWDEIAKAAALVAPTKTVFLGNGDLKTLADARSKIAEIDGLDGVLIGRATFGNPWFFSEHIPTQKERIDVIIEHAHYLQTHFPNQHFDTIKKHLAWYCHSFPGARALRGRLMMTKSAKEVEELLEKSRNVSSL